MDSAQARVLVVGPFTLHHANVFRSHRRLFGNLVKNEAGENLLDPDGMYSVVMPKRLVGTGVVYKGSGDTPRATNLVWKTVQGAWEAERFRQFTEGAAYQELATLSRVPRYLGCGRVAVDQLKRYATKIDGDAFGPIERVWCVVMDQLPGSTLHDMVHRCGMDARLLATLGVCDLGFVDHVEHVFVMKEGDRNLQNLEKSRHDPCIPDIHNIPEHVSPLELMLWRVLHTLLVCGVTGDPTVFGTNHMINSFVQRVLLLQAGTRITAYSPYFPYRTNQRIMSLTGVEFELGDLKMTAAMCNDSAVALAFVNVVTKSVAHIRHCLKLSMHHCDFKTENIQCLASS